MSVYSVGLLEGALECVEAFVPETFVEAQPGVRLGEPLRGKPDAMRAACDLSLDEAGFFQHFQVLARGRERHAVGRREFADAAFMHAQLAQHCPARPVGERVEYLVELSGFILNEVVEYSSSPAIIQPPG